MALGLSSTGEIAEGPCRTASLPVSSPSSLLLIVQPQVVVETEVEPMIAVALLAVGVPSLLGIASLGLRRQSEGLSGDLRGIALQTVIIMVVLLVIAGAVAGVLLSRGNQAVTDLERQDVTQAATNYTHRNLCRAAGYSWASAAGLGTTTGTYCSDP